jgi:hypothetical protein
MDGLLVVCRSKRTRAGANQSNYVSSSGHRDFHPSLLRARSPGRPTAFHWTVKQEMMVEKTREGGCGEAMGSLGAFVGSLFEIKAKEQGGSQNVSSSGQTSRPSSSNGPSCNVVAEEGFRPFLSFGWGDVGGGGNRTVFSLWMGGTYSPQAIDLFGLVCCIECNNGENGVFPLFPPCHVKSRCQPTCVARSSPPRENTHDSSNEPARCTTRSIGSARTDGARQEKLAWRRPPWARSPVS